MFWLTDAIFYWFLSLPIFILCSELDVPALFYLKTFDTTFDAAEF